MCLRCKELVLSEAGAQGGHKVEEAPRELMAAWFPSSPLGPSTLLGIQFCVPGPHPQPGRDPTPSWWFWLTPDVRGSCLAAHTPPYQPPSQEYGDPEERGLLQSQHSSTFFPFSK